MSWPEHARDGVSGPSTVLGGAPAIVTPDAVPLEIEVATVGSRGAAFFVDLLIFGGVFALLGIAQMVLGGAGFVPGWLAIAVLLVLTFVWQFGYPITFETRWRGRTPGKALLGLRVVTTDGAPIGVRHAAVRATVGWFELFATVGIVAVATSLISARSQRLGDLAAGTIVVREHRRARAPQVATFSAPAGYEHYVAILDVSGIGPPLQATIRDTLRRRQQLPPHAAAPLVARLADHVAAQVGPPPPSNADAQTFLQCVAAAVQARSRTLGTPPAPSSASSSPGSDGQGEHGPRRAPAMASYPTSGSGTPRSTAPPRPKPPDDDSMTLRAETDRPGADPDPPGGGFQAPR